MLATSHILFLSAMRMETTNPSSVTTDMGTVGAQMKMEIPFQGQQSGAKPTAKHRVSDRND